MDNVFNKLYKCGYKLICGLALAGLIYVLAVSLFTHVYCTMDFTEVSQIRLHTPLFPIGAAAACVGFALLKKLLEKFTDTQLFSALTLVYIIAGAFLILNVTPKITGDAGMVFGYAQKFTDGDYSGLLPGKYMNFFPYQLGLLTFERIFGTISWATRFFYGIYLALTIGADFFMWRTMRLLFGANDIRTKYGVLLSFLFLPGFFYIIFVYGEGPGFFFMAAAVWFVTGYLKNTGKWNIVGAVLSIGLSCVCRINFYIAAIALMIVFILYFFRTGKAKHLVSAVLLIAVPFLMVNGLQLGYRQASGMDFEGGPMVLSIAMGMQESSRAPGWYNGYNFETFEASGYDVARSEELGKASIAERLSAFSEDPSYALSFWSRKMVTQWGDPTYHSVWTSHEQGKDSQNRIIESAFTGGYVYYAVEYFSNFVNIIICLGAIWYIIRKHKKTGEELSPEDLFFPLFFLGGFLFSILWEANSQYTYGYLMWTIPIAGAGFLLLADDVKRLFRRK